MRPRKTGYACLKGSLSERFERMVDRTPGKGPWGDCWEWMGTREKFGYGRISERLSDGRYRHRQAHAVAWELHSGLAVGDQWVLHRCDNPACVRWDHLFLGNAKLNAEDRDVKGRGGVSRGERNGVS